MGELALVLLGFLVAVQVPIIVLYALCQKHEVKAGLKIPFVAFFLEAKDRDEGHVRAKKESEGG